jgi:hypothetical protein
MIAIRMEGKYGICAPYPCNGSHYHMTSNASTVRRYYQKRKEQRMDARERDERNESGGMADALEDPSPLETDNETGPGPWVTAGFDGPCSRGFCSGISAGEDIRADGSGDPDGWECRGCVESGMLESDGYDPRIPQWFV